MGEHHEYFCKKVPSKFSNIQNQIKTIIVHEFKNSCSLNGENWQSPHHLCERKAYQVPEAEAVCSGQALCLCFGLCSILNMQSIV